MPRRDFASPAMAAIASLALLLAVPGARGADVERGQALYELGCMLCHSESVHGRKARVATDFDDIRVWVKRWNDHLALAWTEDDVDSVAIYLNSQYYRFPCPPQVCKVVSINVAAPRPAAR